MVVLKMNSQSLESLLRGAIEDHRSVVSAAGIRYGSVMYIAFGTGKIKPVTRSIMALIYPVEIEIGSDSWHLCKSDANVIGSEYENIEKVRDELQNLLVGRKLRQVLPESGRILFKFSDEVTLHADVRVDQASGFLYSLSVEGRGTWETLDGITASRMD